MVGNWRAGYASDVRPRLDGGQIVTMPVFQSASTKAVRRVLTAAYPEHGVTRSLLVDDDQENGLKTVSVTGYDYSLRGDALTRSCLDLYARARAVSSVPVSIVVKGYAGAGRMLNAEIDSAADALSTKFSVTAILVLAWPEGSSVEHAKLEVLTANPMHTAMLTAMLDTKKP